MTNSGFPADWWEKAKDDINGYYNGKPCPDHGEDRMRRGSMVPSSVGYRSVYTCSECGYETLRALTTGKYERLDRIMDMRGG